MYDKSLTIEQNLALLAATPRHIADFTRTCGMVDKRCARPSARLFRHVGQVYYTDPKRGPSHVQGDEPHDLDQADELSRTGIWTLAAGVYCPTDRPLEGVEALAAGSLVSHGYGDHSGKATRTNRAHL